jgi:hypothetical protein
MISTKLALTRETVRLAGPRSAQLLSDWQHNRNGVHDHAASARNSLPAASNEGT